MTLRLFWICVGLIILALFVWFWIGVGNPITILGQYWQILLPIALLGALCGALLAYIALSWIIVTLGSHDRDARLQELIRARDAALREAKRYISERGAALAAKETRLVELETTLKEKAHRVEHEKILSQTIMADALMEKEVAELRRINATHGFHRLQKKLEKLKTKSPS